MKVKPDEVSELPKIAAPVPETGVAPIDLDQLRASQDARLAGLEEKRQRLSLDALTDEGARKQLERVETEISEAHANRERVNLAEAERQRRDAETLAAAAEQARQVAEKKARGLQTEREKAAKVVDRRLAAFMEALATWADTCRAQSHQLKAAGLDEAARMAVPKALPLEGAFIGQLAAHRGSIPADFLGRLPLIPHSHRRPLVESDLNPIDPA